MQKLGGVLLLLWTALFGLLFLGIPETVYYLETQPKSGPVVNVVLVSGMHATVTSGGPAQLEAASPQAFVITLPDGKPIKSQRSEVPLGVNTVYRQYHTIPPQEVGSGQILLVSGDRVDLRLTNLNGVSVSPKFSKTFPEWWVDYFTITSLAAPLGGLLLPTLIVAFWIGGVAYTWKRLSTEQTAS